MAGTFVYWIDAQLPPALAPWLTATFGVEAYSAAYLGYREAEDEVIFQAARAAGAVVVSKDADFLERVVRLGTGATR
jgi:predicted nuclease of predicted toxin-antitoxin system